MALDVYKEWLGIPEEFRPPDHYALLRLVQFEDDPEKIRANYKKLNGHVRKYATGQYSTESQDLLNELAKAMLCLTDPVRKRSYDESLGREFEEEYGPSGRKPIGQVLVDQGHLSRSQLAEVEQFAEKRGLSVRDAVVQMKLADPATAARALAEERGLSFVDLNELMPDDSVLDRVPRNTVKRHSILPLFVDDDVLLVACVDELEPELEEELRMRFGVPMRGVIATPLSINQGIAKFYAPGMREDVADEIPTTESGKPEKASKSKKKKSESGSAPAPRKQRRSGPLTAEELQERKQMGILMMCGGVTIPLLIGIFVLNPLFNLEGGMGRALLSYLPAILIAPLVVLYVIFVYWKEK